ncbi:penicillin-insensitive murein endopeptidase [Myxococcota bacterium]
MLLGSRDVVRATVAARLAPIRVTFEPCNPTRSIGKPWKGSLKCGQLLPRHPRITPMSAVHFGTAQTNRAILGAADYFDEADPDGPAIEVYDLSLVGGGRAPYHVSHQTGRDVDFGLFYESGQVPSEVFVEVPFSSIDMKRTWLLIEGLLNTDRVQRIFVDYELQALLHAEAMRRDPKLGRVFQYPEGVIKRKGIIRHWPHHREHLHVRFACPKGHKQCRS